MSTSLFGRKNLRKLFKKLYNERSELTIINTDLEDVAYIDYHISYKGAEEVPYEVAKELVRQDLIEITSGNEYYGEENYIINRTNIIKIAPTLRYDVGDTVSCTLKNFEDQTYSGFITGWMLQELGALYINDLRIIPSTVMLTRKILIEKIKAPNQERPLWTKWTKLRID